MSSSIQQYLRDVDNVHAAGDATEHTYRAALQALVESLASNVTATNEPKRIACGAPDFIVNVKDAPVGYIECKDIGVSLDETETSEQLQRYFASLGNLILTDYVEFRYYVAGEPTMQVVLASRDAKGKIKPVPGAEDQLMSLFTAFFSARIQPINTPKDLAARLANLAKVIRDAIERAFAVEDAAGTLHGEYESFRATLHKGMSPSQFADMYAQTVCYGMFSARMNVPDDKVTTFTRQHAAYDLPPTNPFLREVFEYIAGTRLDASIVWAVDLLADILRRCDMHAILKQFGKGAGKEDPVVHFYETFLTAYDPALREARGVYYTPEPVVQNIVRSIDAILKRDFACPQGLADPGKITIQVPDADHGSGKARREVHRVQILDPATGTGTFHYAIIRLIHETLVANRGSWAGANGYVAQHLLPRLYGFELMMAPYAVAHFKLGWLLKQTGYDFAAEQRLRIYLTNTLQEAEIVAGPLFAGLIAREANAASSVKTDCPIMVVVGNPPYSGLSANMTKWTDDLLKKRLPLPNGAPGYYECDGEPLGEKKVWLQDDYVKFIRFAQYRIERTGYGVLGFITNNGYLDNPTFRGMRQSLMHTFDDIYILDLHGNAKKKETAPDGSKDENVFDITQGVAIGLFIKRGSAPPRKPARVFHAELWGARERKYQWLASHDVRSQIWKPLTPNSPHYFFVPRDESQRGEYEQWPSLAELFPANVTGIVTARDDFAIDLDRNALLERMVEFTRSRDSAAGLLEKFGLTENYAWRVEQAQAELKEALAATPREQLLKRILYRPFDARYIFYHRSVVWRTRADMMHHMLADQNLSLCTTRSIEIGRGWEHVFCASQMIQHHSVSLKEVNYQFPLYLYPNGDELIHSSPWPAGVDGRRPNLSPETVGDLARKLRLVFVSDGAGDLKKTFGPDDVFRYAYALFHSPTYRARYAPFLKVDFPRLPLTGDRKLFARLCAAGADLVTLHLLERVPEPRVTYPRPGDSMVDQPRYKPPTDDAPGRVYVNKEQYFQSVPPEVWEFHVGGYQVCEKWLKDRKGRLLSYDDIQTYRKITEALRQTLRLMDEIDAAIRDWPLR